MTKALRYLSISHETASVKHREKFYIADNEKERVIKRLITVFPDICGLLLLVTCNRTEVYFESDTSSAKSLLRFLLDDIFKEESPREENFFVVNEDTTISVRHLLEVSSGLVSKVFGDAEIFSQIKKAYQLAITYKLQGSLLERAMQTVSKVHKRIRNETQFRDGTTSVAYKALKIIEETYGRDLAKDKKILFIGAGDIVKQLFKYNLKFGYKRIYISNRTKSKALLLTDKYLGQLFDWDKVLANDFEDFDVIISAAGNCPQLITNLKPHHGMRLLLDLALPGNVDSALGTKANVQFYDIDTISSEIEENKEKRMAAIEHVETIKEEEMDEFKKWYEEAPLRIVLGRYKIIVNQEINGYLKTKGEPVDNEKIKLITDQVIRNFIKERGRKNLTHEIDSSINTYYNFNQS